MRRAALAAGVLTTALLAGCGSSSPSVVNAPTSGAPVSSVSVGSSPAASRSAGRLRQTVRIVPATGLHNRQQVQVHGSGFTPGEALQVVECAARGNATGPGDCNLSGMLSVNAGSDGRVTTTLTVLRGPFGAGRVVCSAHAPCLVSVTQASLQPTEEADAVIRFAP